MTWCRLHYHKYPELRWIMAIPNGGARNIVVAAKLKAEGVKKGVPDLMLPTRRGGYAGCWIEMKRRKGGRMEPEQIEWRDYLLGAGYWHMVCKGWEEAKDALEEYLALEP